MNTIKFEDGNYFSRAWRITTDGKDIFKVLLLLTLIINIPIVGIFWALGYVLEWARLTAWGVESYPKTSNMQPGRCIATGFKGTVVGVGWMIIVHFLVKAIGFIGGNSFLLSDLAYLLITVIQVISVCFISAVMLRATIYQNISEGYNFTEIYNLFNKDWKGFLKITGIQMLINIVFMVITTMIFSIFLFGVVSTSLISMSVTDLDVSTLIDLIPGVSGTSILLLFLLFAGSIFTAMLHFNMLGLWMMQFNDGCKQNTAEEEVEDVEDKVVEKIVVENTDIDTREVPDLLYGTSPVKVEKRYHEETLKKEAPKGLYDVEVAKVERRYHEDEE